MAKIDATKKTTLDTNLAGSVVASSSAMKNVIDDYANVINSNSPEGRYAADAGSTDAYAITLDPVPTAYVTGMIYRFKANTGNTGACSLNVNTLGAKTIKKNATDDMETGDILADQFVEVMYDGTNMQVISVTSELKTHKAEDVTTGDTPHGIVYEEGSWTPTITAGGGSVATYTTQVGRYIRSNNLITVHFDVTVNDAGTLVAGSQVNVSGLPFSVGTDWSSGAMVYWENVALDVGYTGVVFIPLVANSLAQGFRVGDNKAITSLNGSRVVTGSRLKGTLIYKIN